MTDLRRILRRTLAGALLAAASASAHANAARLGGGEDLYVSLSRIVVALLIAIVLIVAAAVLIRQHGGKHDLAAVLGRVRLKSRNIDVLEARRLSPHADICLVRHRSREYLLLLGSGHGRVLSCVDVEPDAEAGAPARDR